MDLAGGGVNAATRGEHNGEASRGERGIHYLDPETGHRRRPDPVAGREHRGAPEPGDLAARARGEKLRRESRPALDVIDEICAVPGLAGLHIGPTDLSLGLGLGTERTLPAFDEALVKIISAGHAAGLPVTMHAVRPDRLGAMIDLGFDEIVLSTDIEVLRSSFAAQIAHVRGTAAAPVGAYGRQ